MLYEADDLQPFWLRRRAQAGHTSHTLSFVLQYAAMAANAPSRIAVVLKLVPLASCAITGDMLDVKSLVQKLSTPGSVRGALSSKGFTNPSHEHCLVYVVQLQPAPRGIQCSDIAGKIIALARSTVEGNWLATFADTKLRQHGLATVVAGVEMFVDARDSMYYGADGVLVSWTNARGYSGRIPRRNTLLSRQCRMLGPVGNAAADSESDLEIL